MVKKDKCKALFLLFLLFAITINAVPAYSMDVTAPDDLQIERGSSEEISIKVYLPNSFPVANDINVSLKVVNCSETLYSTVISAMGSDSTVDYDKYINISPDVRNIYQIMPGSSRFAYFKICTAGNTPKRTYEIDTTVKYMMVNKDNDAKCTDDEFIYDTQTKKFHMTIVEGKGNIEVINDITPSILRSLNISTSNSTSTSTSISNGTQSNVDSKINPNIVIYVDGEKISNVSFNKTLNEGIHFIGIDGLDINHSDKRTIKVSAGATEKIYLSKFFEDHFEKYASEHNLIVEHDCDSESSSNGIVIKTTSGVNKSSSDISSDTALDAERVLIGTVADKEVTVYMTPERYYLLIALLILFAGVLVTVVIVNLLKSKKEEKDE
ncbi:hypothetical protein J2127_001450 [Methanococcus voltae]|uniref:hypothetical protein n=1 Tax=Methanococcus voltae TaxID=2188 RepID=UPI001AEAFA9A|nr:hypothetical protein [Methanococcus voltae]MBP2144280.1 hypothetical protein [Methanococcus voltae]